MDRRVLSLMVFCFTLISTFIIAFVCVMTGQTAFNTVVYSFVTMWVVGIVSQVVLSHLYLGVVRPIEEDQYDRRLAEAKAKINIDEIEEIDQIDELEKAKKQARQVEEGGR